MVQLVNSGNFGPVSESRKLPVKLEIEDSLDEEHGPLNKRAKFSVPFHQQWSTGDSNTTPHPAQYNPLNEPSPLGLRLRKSPSLLDLIQMRLSQVNAATVGAASGENLELGKMKDAKCNGVSGTTEKLKASNFPVSLLRIGTWECISRYEGDLVAKCYFAKHKLVWEVLEGGLKNKMEIQWSDITALKATCPENGPGTLDVVLARPPLFFRETNPQPRKHTLWQATTDFTGGQASMHRRHCLQCPQGLLSKHFEKLIQCDPRLKLLSQQPEVVLDSPYFEARVSFFEDQTEAKSCVLNHMKTEYVSTFSSFQDSPSPSVAQSSSSGSELRHPVSRASEAASLGSPSPCSVMDTQATEDNGGSETKEQKEPNQWDQLKFHGLHSSMSMSDLVNHIGNRISEHMTSANPLLSSQAHSRSREMLDEITQYLLSDSQCASTSTSDEQPLMSRVNSLCCLLQKDPATIQKPRNEGRLGGGGSETKEQKEPNQWGQLKFRGLHSSMSISDLVNQIGNCISEQMTSANPLLSSQARSRSGEMLDEITQYLLSDSQCASTSDEQPLMSRVNSLCCLLQKDPATIQKLRNEGRLGGEDCMNGQPNSVPESTCGDTLASDGSGCKQLPAISRKESFGELLLHLPRIASMPQFLFNIAEDGDNQAR